MQTSVSFVLGTSQAGSTGWRRQPTHVGTAGFRDTGLFYSEDGVLLTLAGVVADVFRRDDEDDVFGDVRGVVADALEVP